MIIFSGQCLERLVRLKPTYQSLPGIPLLEQLQLTSSAWKGGSFYQADVLLLGLGFMMGIYGKVFNHLI
jgi:hypothetical protein